MENNQKELRQIISCLSENGKTKTNSLGEFLNYLQSLTGIHSVNLQDSNGKLTLGLSSHGFQIFFSHPKLNQEEKLIAEHFRISIINYIKNLLFQNENREANRKELEK